MGLSGSKSATPKGYPPGHKKSITLNQNHDLNYSCSEQSTIVEDSQFQFEELGCCGISNRKNKRTVTWEESVLRYCDIYMARDKEFVNQVVKIVKNLANSSKNSDNKNINIQKKFRREFNDIKYFQVEPKENQKQMSLTAPEIVNFKANLRNSVLLHYDQVKKQRSEVVNEKVNESIRIESVIQLSQSVTNNSGNKNKKSFTKKSTNRYLEHLSGANQSTVSNLGLSHRASLSIRQSSIIQGAKRSLITSSQSQETAHPHLRESVISLVDDTMTSIFKGEEKEISKYNAYELDVFVKFTIMLQRHLNNPENAISQIITAFINHLWKGFGSYVNNSNRKQNSKKQKMEDNCISSLQLQELIQKIKLFLGLLVQIVEDFYHIRPPSQLLDQPQSSKSQIQKQGNSTPNPILNTHLHSPHNHLISNYQNLLTILTAILFKNEKFYSLLFPIVKQFNNEKQYKIKQKFYQLHGKSPQYFSINREYCLNNSTFKNYIQQMSSIESNIENFTPDDLTSQIDQPYACCSESLQKLETSKTPISKMKCILDCAQGITPCIAKFYRKNNLNLKKNMLDADQVLSIFCYILSIHFIRDLYSHLFIIQQFATEHQKISIAGYYFSVICCAAEDVFGGNGQQKEDQLHHKGSLESKQSEKNTSSGIKQNNELAPVSTLTQSVRKSRNEKQPVVLKKVTTVSYPVNQQSQQNNKSLSHKNSLKINIIQQYEIKQEQQQTKQQKQAPKQQESQVQVQVQAQVQNDEIKAQKQRQISNFTFVAQKILAHVSSPSLDSKNIS